MRFVRISEKLHPSPERDVIRSSTLVANHCCRTGGRVSCRKVGVRLCTMRVRRHRSARIDLNSSSLPPGFLDCHAIDLAEFNDVIVVDSTIRNQSTGIARSRCESSGFGVAPAVDTTVPGASVVGEGPGAGGGGDVVGVGGVDLDVVHRPGAPGRPDVGRTEPSGLGESLFPRQNEGELMMRPAKIQWALGHRRVASGEFSQTPPECLSVWTSGFVCVGGGSTRGSAAGGGCGPGTRPAPRAVSRRLRAGPRRVCGRRARPGRSRRSGARRL